MLEKFRESGKEDKAERERRVVCNMYCAVRGSGKLNLTKSFNSLKRKINSYCFTRRLVFRTFETYCVIVESCLIVPTFQLRLLIYSFFTHFLNISFLILTLITFSLSSFTIILYFLFFNCFC